MRRALAVLLAVLAAGCAAHAPVAEAPPPVSDEELDLPVAPGVTKKIVLPDPVIRANLAEGYAATRSVHPGTVVADVDGGVVTLRGTVASISERNLAIAVAATSPGVRRVKPKLIVKPATRAEWPAHDARGIADVATDQQLLAEVRRRISATNQVRVAELDVQVCMGVVILSGPVESAAVRARLRETALYIPRVRGVVNNLWVPGE
ncbi:MAG: BON domain-containing protein [Deltaproteobacteria bacterium]|nr:BON domain-containing protein [Deltaproteobacteria bacterium]